MALPDYFKRQHGTAVVWGHPGGAGVTANLSLNNLANNVSRMGVAADLGSPWNQMQAVWLYIETGTAPTAGNAVYLYLSCARVASGEWPGGVSGLDADYQTTQADNDEHLKQLGNPVIVLPATADANTVQRQAPVFWMPQGPHVVPVVYNRLGVATRNQGTPANNGSRVIMIPARDLVQDAA